MKLNLHPKGIPKQEPLGADTPLKKGGVVVGMRMICTPNTGHPVLGVFL